MRRRKILAIVIITFGVGLTTVTFYGYQVVTSPNILVEMEPEVLLIPKGATFKSVQDSLYDNGYVYDLVAFSFLAKVVSLDKKIKPGRYQLSSNMSNLEMVRLLNSGAQAPVNLTFNNVRRIQDLAPKICRNISLDPIDFKRALDHFIDTNPYGFNENNVISMFIPNTYQVYWTISGEELIERMYEEYQVFWNEERTAKAKEIGLSKIEVSTLASLVIAEQRLHKDEWRKIAGLYMNRLNIGMKLDSDPTLIFAIGDFSIKRVLHIHKEVDSPYNTYKYNGLPPGPIYMPEIGTIDAVLNYEKHDYLFMVAKEDFSGYHRFATNIDDHIKNAAKYQRALTAEQRKAERNN